MKAAKPKLKLAVQYASAAPMQDLPARPFVRRCVAAALEQDAEVTVRFVDEAEGRQLNASYRGKDAATNVLSFAYAAHPVVAGDLALCAPVVLREAAEQGKTARAHYAHLIVHGMLHLQGFEHETHEEDARRMEAREREILARLGFADPYVTEHS